MDFFSKIQYNTGIYALPIYSHSLAAKPVYMYRFVTVRAAKNAKSPMYCKAAINMKLKFRTYYLELIPGREVSLSADSRNLS